MIFKYLLISPVTFNQPLTLSKDKNKDFFQYCFYHHHITKNFQNLSCHPSIYRFNSPYHSDMSIPSKQTNQATLIFRYSSSFRTSISFQITFKIRFTIELKEKVPVSHSYRYSFLPLVLNSATSILTHK